MSDSSLRSAIVALRAPGLPTVEALGKAYAQHFPEAPALTAEANDDGTTLSCHVRDAVHCLSLCPSPVPWSELLGPCQTARHWPEAKRCMQGHTAHIVVAASSATRDAVDLMLSLTRITTVVALSTQSVGIYWKAALQVHHVKDFANEAEAASRVQLPLYLWLRFGLVREDDGSTTLYTRGLGAFDLMEVEIPHARLDPQTLVDRAFNVAHYLLDRGAVVEHGHTIGRTQDERFEVTHGPSVLDPERHVYSLRAHAP